MFGLFGPDGDRDATSSGRPPLSAGGRSCVDLGRPLEVANCISAQSVPVDCGISRPIGANTLNRERQIFYMIWTKLDVSMRCRIPSEINADSQAGRNVGCGQNTSRSGQNVTIM